MERAQQTLVGLARATDEGGEYWSDHLPFYLLLMRTTAERVTRQSPASLLYGRELRLPAQISGPRPVAEYTMNDTVPVKRCGRTR